MRQSGSNAPAGVFLAGKYKQADDRKDKLLNVINRLSQLAYEKGTRQSDEAIRGRLKELAGEVEQHYRTIRAFGSGKVGDASAFQDILEYFNSRYLERFVLREKYEEVRQEIVAQDNLDRSYHESHTDADHVRKVNIYRQDLERELGEWEKLLLQQVDPLLRGFLTEVNEIVLFNRLAQLIDRLLTNDDVFARSGQVYQEFKDVIAYYAELHIKLTRVPLTDAQIIEDINRILQLMGFRNSIMRARNINAEIYNEIMMEIVAGSSLRQLVLQYADTSRGAIDAIRSKESKPGDAPSARDLVPALEELIYLEESRDVRKPAGMTAASGLSTKEADRYLFHSPGTFDISLKFVSEYLRDSLIFILDWLNKDTKKSSDSSAILGPVIECIPTMRIFSAFYRLALEEASNRSNQIGSGSKERHYISRQVARGLIKSIQDNCTAIKHSLIDVSYSIMNSTHDRTGVLAKKMDVIKDSCNASYAKITRGLSEIPKV
jgi:hypothetical protein